MTEFKRNETGPPMWEMGKIHDEELHLFLLGRLNALTKKWSHFIHTDRTRQDTASFQYDSSN
jgi:hypothetical protein